MSTKQTKNNFQKRKRSNQVAVIKDNGTLNHSKQFSDSQIFTIEGNHHVC